MKITDSVTLGDARVSDSGYLEANARTARVGIQQYLGSEVGKPELAVVNVYRDQSEVFNKAALDTFSKIPITNDHPPVSVTAENWKDFAVGTTGDEVLRDGEYLKIGLKITDAAAVKAVREGKRELSVGYETVLVWEDGIAPDGTKYQAKQTAIKANHVAIVSAGRAGKEVRIGDASKWGAAPITPNPEKETRAMSDALRTVVVDGLSVQTTDQGAQAISKLQKALADSAANVAKLQTDHAAALAAKDAELAKAHAERDAEKDKVLSDADLDKRVQARADLIGKAKAIARDVKTDGLSDAAIRKAAVTAALGDEAVKDKADAYIDARFDILVEDAAKNQPDAFRDAMKSRTTPVNNDDNGQAAYEQRLSDAWKMKKEA